jgi:hypothetical protein
LQDATKTNKQTRTVDTGYQAKDGTRTRKEPACKKDERSEEQKLFHSKENYLDTSKSARTTTTTTTTAAAATACFYTDILQILGKHLKCL